MSSSALQNATKSIIAWGISVGEASPSPSKAIEKFGSLTFSDAVQRQRLPKDVYKALRKTITQGEPLDASTADVIAATLKDWAIEHGGRPRGRRVRRQGADQGRARRVELSVRRHALHVRGARLHGLGSDEPAVAARDAERHHAGHSDRVRELDG
jgi:hypothetical protein